MWLRWTSLQHYRTSCRKSRCRPSQQYFSVCSKRHRLSWTPLATGLIKKCMAFACEEGSRLYPQPEDLIWAMTMPKCKRMYNSVCLLTLVTIKNHFNQSNKLIWFCKMCIHSVASLHGKHAMRFPFNLLQLVVYKLSKQMT